MDAPASVGREVRALARSSVGRAALSFQEGPGHGCDGSKAQDVANPGYYLRPAQHPCPPTSLKVASDQRKLWKVKWLIQVTS